MHPALLLARGQPSTLNGASIDILEKRVWDSLWRHSCTWVPRLFLTLAWEAYNEGFSRFSVGVWLYTPTHRFFKWENCRECLWRCLEGKRSLCLWCLWTPGKVHHHRHHHHYHHHHHHQNNSKHCAKPCPKHTITFNLHHTHWGSCYYPHFTDKNTTAQGIRSASQ